MFSLVKNKLKKNNGESIAETLVSVLIIAICLVMLSHAIVVAGKINSVAESEINPFTKDGTAQTCTITVTRGTTKKQTSRTCYISSGGYYYYE